MFLHGQAPWRLHVLRNGRAEVHESPAVAGVLAKLAEAVGRAAEEGGGVRVHLESPCGHVVFAGTAGRGLNWETAAVVERVREEMTADPEGWAAWVEDAEAGLDAVEAAVAGLVCLDDAPTALARRVLAHFLRQVNAAVVQEFVFALARHGDPAAR